MGVTFKDFFYLCINIGRLITNLSKTKTIVSKILSKEI